MKLEERSFVGTQGSWQITFRGAGISFRWKKDDGGGCENGGGELRATWVMKSKIILLRRDAGVFPWLYSSGGGLKVHGEKGDHEVSITWVKARGQESISL